MGYQKLKIIHENCDPELAKDKRLPYTAYLVEYVKEEKTCYDIAIGNNTVEMFDHYYDKYKKGLIGWKQSEGQVPPKLWTEKMLKDIKKPEQPKKKPTKKKKEE